MVPDSDIKAFGYGSETWKNIIFWSPLFYRKKFCFQISFQFLAKQKKVNKKGEKLVFNLIIITRNVPRISLANISFRSALVAKGVGRPNLHEKCFWQCDAIRWEQFLRRCRLGQSFNKTNLKRDWKKNAYLQRETHHILLL